MSFQMSVTNKDLPQTVRKSPRAISVAVEEVAWETRRRVKATSPKKSGTLRNSWKKKKMGDLLYSVSTNVKYAKWVNDGTGIYGSGRPITPKRAKFLRFEWRGSLIFARSVRGQKGQKYVEEAVLQTEKVTDRVMISKLKKEGLLS